MAEIAVVNAPLLVDKPAAKSIGQESAWGRRILIGITVLFLTVMILIPVINVFQQAFSRGIDAYISIFFPPSPPAEVSSFAERRAFVSAAAQADRTWHAIWLTVVVAAIVIPLNVIFGLAAAWAITKFNFHGRIALSTLTTIPFSVSPVVAGLAFILLLGRGGIFGDWAGRLQWPDPTSLTWVGFSESYWPFAFHDYNTGIIFTQLAVLIVTIFVTIPFVATALIPLQKSLGSDQELAALSLGASGWRSFFKITLPNIKWGVIYGVILTFTRAVGEFGAVAVVSGHIDSNDTLPLRVEKLWNEYNNQAAFAVATILVFLALLSLVAKLAVERKTVKSVR